MKPPQWPVSSCEACESAGTRPAGTSRTVFETALTCPGKRVSIAHANSGEVSISRAVGRLGQDGRGKHCDQERSEEMNFHVEIVTGAQHFGKSEFSKTARSIIFTKVNIRLSRK